MFSCEISKIFKNTYFEEHLRMTADQMVEKDTVSADPK